MAAAPRQVDKQSLKNLVPLNGLSHTHFDELITKSEIKDLPAGRFLFREGDRDGVTYFLLAGEIALLQGREVKQTLQAGAEGALHPIGQAQPRQWSAKAQGRISVLAVDSGLLDVLLAWDQSNGYEVTDIQAEDDEDWMTRMLSSELFQRLSASNIQQVLMRMEEVTVEAGQRVVSQDEEGDYYYIVKQGIAEVSRKPSVHAKPVKIARLSDGDSFGEEALLSGARRNASVTMTTAGVLMRLAKSDFDSLLREPLIAHIDYNQARKLAEQGAIWLDVRLPGEFDNAHLPKSTNLPLAAVRDAAAELNPAHRYIVCCDTGTRSVGAAFLLSQRGLDALVLRDGLNGVPHDQLQRSQPTNAAATESGAEIIEFNSRAEEPSARSEQDPKRPKAGVPARDARRETEAASTELEALQRQIRERQTRVEALEQSMQDKEKALRALHRSFESAEAMGEELQSLRSEFEQAQLQLKQQRDQIEQSHHAGAEREQELTSLREQFNELQQQFEQAQAERAAHERAGAALQADLEALQRGGEDRMRELDERLQAALAERDGALAAVAERQHSLLETQAQLEASQRARTDSDHDASAQRERLEQELKSARDSLESAQSERERLQAELEAARGEAERQASLLAENQALRKGETQTQRQELADAQQRAEQLARQLEIETGVAGERASEITALNSRVQQLESADAARQAELASREEEWSQLRSELENKLQASQEQAQSLGDTVQRLEREREASADELHARVGELEAQLQQRESVLSENEQTLARLNAKLEQLERARNEAETTLVEREQQWAQSRQSLEQELTDSAHQAQQRAEALEAELAQRLSSHEANEAVRAQLDSELSRLREEHTALQSRLEQAHAHDEQQLSGLHERIRELETDLGQRAEALRVQDTERERLESRLQALSQEQAALQVDLEQAQAREAQLNAETDKLRGERQETESELQSRVQTIGEEAAALRADLEQAQAREMQLNAELDDLRGERQASESDLQVRLQTLTDEAAAVRADLEQAQAREAQLGTQIETLRNERDDAEAVLQARIDALEEELRQSGEALGNHDAERQRQEAELKVLNDERAALHVSIEQAQAREAQLTAELEALRSARDASEHELRSQLSDAQAEVARVRADFETRLARQRGEVQSELERARRDGERVRSEYEDAQRSLDKLRQEQEQHAVELKELQQERKKLKEHVAELEGWLVRAERKRDDSERQLEERGQELAALREYLDEARREANAARERAAALSQELEAGDREDDDRLQLREEAASARAELCNLSERLQEAEREAARSEQRRAAAEQAHEALKDDAESLQHELSQLRAQYREDVDEAAGVREALERRQQELQQDARRAQEQFAAAEGAQRDAEFALRTVEHEAETLRRELDQARESLAQAQAESERLGSILSQQGDEPGVSEVTSIRELADEELRHAASELARLRDELAASRRQVQRLEADAGVARNLEMEAQHAAQDMRPVHLQAGADPAQYQPVSDAAPADVAPPSGARRRGGFAGARALLGLLLLAGVGAGGWYWHLQRAGAPATPARPPLSQALSALKADVQAQIAAKPQANAGGDRESVKKPAAGEPSGAAAAAPVRPGRTYQDFLADGSLGPVLVQLPGGAFTMGSPESAPYFDERPAHTVRLKPFSISKYEVTFSDYDRFAGATGRARPEDHGWGRGQRPVVGVSWDDAQAYAAWLSAGTGHRYRLPTEAEWEFAARAGTDTFFWWGSQAQDGKANCFNCGNKWSGSMTAPVGSFEANPMGLYDTAGNVLEWVQDCYRDNYQGAAADGRAAETANCEARVARGGSYRTVQENLRSARRAQYSPATRIDQLGFRLVREP